MRILVTAIAFLSFFVSGCSPSEEEIELKRLQQLENDYRKILIKESKQITKTVFKYEHHTRIRQAGLSGSDPFTITYLVTDAGIHTTEYEKTIVGSLTDREFYWYGSMDDPQKCYVGEDDHCICFDYRGNRNFSYLSFHEKDERDKFYTQFVKGMDQFKKKWSELY